MLGGVAGVVVGTSVIIAGVLSEALYAGIRVRPVLKNDLSQAPPVEPVLTWRAYANFYVPLAIMMLLTLLVQPMVTATLSRMPQALESLAVWPVVFGLLLVWQSIGISYNEVVITLLDVPRAVDSLRRFTTILATVITLLLLLVLGTPLARLWLIHVAALSPKLIPLAEGGLWLGLLLPALRILQSWYQGAITYDRKTRSITESVGLFLIVSGVILGSGVIWGRATGLYVGIVGFMVGLIIQVLWLWHRSRPVLQAIQIRDAAS